MIQEELHMFKNHTFHVNDDKEMEELAESIREHGMLIPGIVRPIAEVRH
jgi:ParB family transcriptional regulator, chromosome partitioning protein